MKIKQRFLDVVDAFDNFTCEHGDWIIPMFWFIVLILVWALFMFLIHSVFEVFIECVQSNETFFGTICRFGVG